MPRSKRTECAVVMSIRGSSSARNRRSAAASRSTRCLAVARRASSTTASPSLSAESSDEEAVEFEYETDTVGSEAAAELMHAAEFEFKHAAGEAGKSDETALSAAASMATVAVAPSPCVASMCTAAASMRRAHAC
jgi:hypothetical protein